MLGVCRLLVLRLSTRRAPLPPLSLSRLTRTPLRSQAWPVREREAKLPVGFDFVVPDLTAVVDDVTAQEPAEHLLYAVYYDTLDLRLARWGASLRHRSGDGAEWTVKLPEDSDGQALVRREFAFHAEPESVPTEAVNLLRAYVREVALQPVVRLQTRRVVIALRDAEGRQVAEVTDDDVSVIEG